MKMKKLYYTKGKGEEYTPFTTNENPNPLYAHSDDVPETTDVVKLKKFTTMYIYENPLKEWLDKLSLYTGHEQVTLNLRENELLIGWLEDETEDEYKERVFILRIQIPRKLQYT